MNISWRKLTVCLTVAVLLIFIGPAFGQLAADEGQAAADNSNNESMRMRVRRLSISAIPPVKDPDSKNQLEQLIEKLQALKPPLLQSRPAPASAADGMLAGPSSAGPSAAVPAEDQSTVTVETGAVTVPLTPKSTKPAGHSAPKAENAKAIDITAIDPANVIDPLASAEALFKEKQFKKACRFYQLALDRMADGTEASDYAWALFQKANCLYHSDTKAADEVYGQLIAKYPTCQWASAAGAQQQIINWHLENNPRAILEKYNCDPNSP